MEKSDKITLIAIIVLVGFFVAVAFHYILGFYFKIGFPYNTFLYDPSKFLSDFAGILPKLKDFAPYHPPGSWQQYFPLSYLILAPFTFFKNYVMASLVFEIIFLALFLLLNIKNFHCKTFNKLQNFQNIFILTALSYPLLLILDRGNVDMIILIFLAGFIFAFQSKKYQMAAILLGIVNAMKPFYFLFLILFLFEKRFKEFFLSLGAAFLFIFGCFLLFKGNVFEQLAVMIQSLIYMQKIVLYGPEEIVVNASCLFMALKFLLYSKIHLVSYSVLNSIYYFLNILISIITIVFAWREKTFWKRVTLLTLYSFLVPAITFDYRLILLFIPIWLFVNEKKKSGFDFIYAFLFGLLLISKKVIAFFTATQLTIIPFSVFVNPLLMILFIGIIVFENLKKRGEE